MQGDIKPREGGEREQVALGSPWLLGGKKGFKGPTGERVTPGMRRQGREGNGPGLLGTHQRKLHELQHEGPKSDWKQTSRQSGNNKLTPSWVFGCALAKFLQEERRGLTAGRNAEGWTGRP